MMEAVCPICLSDYSCRFCQPCPSCAALRARNAVLEKVAKWADKLEISMHRVDRDGNPQYDAWALSSLRAALDAAKEGK